MLAYAPRVPVCVMLRYVQQQEQLAVIFSSLIATHPPPPPPSMPQPTFPDCIKCLKLLLLQQQPQAALLCYNPLGHCA